MPRKTKNKSVGSQIISALTAGDERVIAEVVSAIQNRSNQLDKLLPAIFRAAANQADAVFTVGVTGPPGAGKSSLMKQVLEQLHDEPLGVLLIDPASPFSGGALLGDRLRMDGLISPQHFVRSLSSRGRSGGLCPAVRDLIRVLTLAGKKMVWLETVGVGQNEVEVMNVADLTCVVLTPDSGDVVQTMKAGILEIADCFVVNKADHPRADEMVAHLKSLGVSPEIPVFATVATTGVGVAAWVNFVKSRSHLGAKSERVARQKVGFRNEVRERFFEDLQAFLQTEFGKKEWQRVFSEMQQGKTDPYSFTKNFKGRVFRKFLQKK